MFKKSVKILAVIVAFFAVQQFCHLQTDGFEMCKITSSLPYDSRWEINPVGDFEKREIDAILNQKFHYLGAGLQCYVFQSNDGNYVIKLFKHHHMRPKSWLNHFSLPGKIDKFRTNIIKAREKRLRRHFRSYKIAYQDLLEETGVVYIHLNKTEEFKDPLILVDKIGIAHSLDLNNTEFVLQKKADLVYLTLEKHLKAGDLEAAKNCISSLLDLILTRCKKGIADKDPAIWRNFGFLGGKAVEIDVGSFAKDVFYLKPYWYKQELFYDTLDIKNWLKEHHPELCEYFDQKIETLLADD
jgi:hypothetical protein